MKMNQKLLTPKKKCFKQLKPQNLTKNQNKPFVNVQFFDLDLQISALSPFQASTHKSSVEADEVNQRILGIKDLHSGCIDKSINLCEKCLFFLRVYMFT